MIGLVIQAICRFCSKHRHPAEFVGGGPATGLCWHCLEWAHHAFDVLAGAVPKGCQVCERTAQQIAAATRGDNVRFCLHPKDGIWQVLCGFCSDQYETKRRDLYAKTPYGYAKGLHTKV